MQKFDEEQASRLVPHLPEITPESKWFLASGTSDTSVYAELSYSLQILEVDTNDDWITPIPVMEAFYSLAYEKAKKTDLPPKLDRINGRLGELFTIALKSYKKAQSETVDIDQAAMQLRDVLQQLWGGLAETARIKNRAINLQNLQNSYLRRKRTEYYGILPLRVQILLKLGTHVASYGVFSEE